MMGPKTVFLPLCQLCQPQGSGWPWWRSGTVGTWFWNGVSSSLRGFPAEPTVPTSARPPHLAHVARQRPHSVAALGHAAKKPIEDGVAPFTPTPLTPHWVPAGIPHGPPLQPETLRVVSSPPWSSGGAGRPDPQGNMPHRTGTGACIQIDPEVCLGKVGPVVACRVDVGLFGGSLGPPSPAGQCRPRWPRQLHQF